MLVGLLFAARDAEDRSGKLVATLPFGGLTLIEYQARLIADHGISQVIVIAPRSTPELRGAIARMGRRGLAIDAVGTAAEAAAKLHPLANIVMMADGLVTTQAALAPLAQEGGDALLVFDDVEAPPGFERIGAREIWAGIARLTEARLSEAAALPRDYDVQSSLLRAAAQAGAAHVMLLSDAARAGHAVELRGDALEARAASAVTSMLSARRGWFDRWVVAPIARPLLTHAIRRGVATSVLVSAAGALGLGGLVAIFAGFPASGAIAALAGAGIAATTVTLATLRDETTLMHALVSSVFAIPALALLVLGAASDQTTAQISGRILAIASLLGMALAEQATAGQEHRRWWGSPPAYLAIAAAATVAGLPLVGLALAGAYAAVSLASAIETLNQRT